jgi:D-threonate/D-erythronate kinase
VTGRSANLDGMQALALADDTTGALEIGALFAKDGVPSLVSIEPRLPSLHGALAVDLQTRHLSPEDAYTRTISFCRGLACVPSLYKKTDSALRGNIAAEFRALLDAFPEYPLVYLPAYPALGRTVAEGRLYVHGVPLSQTAFAQDALNPSTDDFIPDLLHRNGCCAPIVLAPSASAVPARLEPGSILIGDAATSHDLEAIAAAVQHIGQPFLAAGPGAFAALWIRSLALPRVPIALPRPRRLLVVGGSAHPASREQIRIARQNHVVLTTPDEWKPSPDAVAQDLAQTVKAALHEPHPDGEQPDGLVIFGGDTAWHILRALEVALVEPHGELLPGIPISVIRVDGRKIVLITKAGSFGSPGVVQEIREKLDAG